MLLDLDGTLVDSSAPIVDGILALAAEEGLAVPTREWAQSRIGFPAEETWELLGAPDPAGALARFRERVLPQVPARSRAMDGARAVLERLARGGTQLAVATTRITRSTLDTLAAVDLDRHIAFVVGGDDVAHHKPAPDVILAALERAGTAPGDALMVGDTAADVGAAHAAGIPCWAVLGGQATHAALRAAGADRILDGIGQLADALDQAYPPTPAGA